MSARTTRIKLVYSEDGSPHKTRSDFRPHYKSYNGYFTRLDREHLSFAFTLGAIVPLAICIYCAVRDARTPKKRFLLAAQIFPLDM